MIRLIIFDLDGVLVETKDLHFKALNSALANFGYDEISYKDHISIYDGKSTMTKLGMMGITNDAAQLVNKRKQEYTSEMLKTELSPNEDLKNTLLDLCEDGYELRIASNSVRQTIETVVEVLGLEDIFDGLVSNQDVINSKPNPEMYLKCMIDSEVGPRETIIIEDSYVGRQGAYNSGAYVCEVNNPSDVTLDRIHSSIRKAEGKKMMWRDPNLNILVPMAGAGSRFAQAGYTFPKPLIEVNGKPMIQVVKENFAMEGQYIFIVQKEHYEKYNLNYMLEAIAPGCKIVQVESLTEGAACTCLLAKEYIDNDNQLIIANSDQYVDWDSSDFMYSLQGSHIDGGVLTFENSHPKWSYARTEEGFITEIREKVVISNDATVGIYHWKRGTDFVKYAEQMMANDVRVNGEFYVAPVYNEAIADGQKFKTYKVNEMFGLGTPEDLNIFLGR